LTEEAAEFATGRVEGALVFLEVAVMDEWSTVVVDHIAEKLFHGDFSQRASPESWANWPLDFKVLPPSARVRPSPPPE
jgi:hypothetical protein